MSTAKIIKHVPPTRNSPRKNIINKPNLSQTVPPTEMQTALLKVKDFFARIFNSSFSVRGYELISLFSFVYIGFKSSQIDEGSYWIFISMIEDKISLSILTNFLVLCIYKTMYFLFTVFFERILEGERIEIIDRVRIRLIFISFALIIFYLSKDEITFILYVTIIITLWSIIWLTTLRSNFIASKPTKEWGKIAKMIVLYVLITICLEIFIKFAMRFDTIASTLF